MSEHEQAKDHLDDAADELRKTMELTRRTLESRLPEIQPGRRVVVSRFPGWMRVDVIAVAAAIVAAAVGAVSLYTALQGRTNARQTAEVAYEICVQTNVVRRDSNQHVRRPLRDLFATAADVLRKSATGARDGARDQLLAAADRLDRDALNVPNYQLADCAPLRPH